MRDLRHLEELSSTAALGMWADDVVIALDRAEAGTELSEAQVDLLREAAKVLDETREWAERPLATPKSARALAASDFALSALTTIAEGRQGKSGRDLLAGMADVLNEAADGRLPSGDTERARPVTVLFGLLGQHQLVASNSVLTSRKEARAWTETPAISSSS
jgi:hypothetical protein